MMAVAKAPADQGSILIVEDEPALVRLLEVRLQMEGYVTAVARTGGQALEMSLRTPPSLVLLDMNLPDISGLEVVRELNIEITSSGLRLNILTGNALSMDIIKAMSLGAYEYWLKPLTRQVFDDGLRRALTGRRPDPAHRIPVR